MNSVRVRAASDRRISLGIRVAGAAVALAIVIHNIPLGVPGVRGIRPVSERLLQPLLFQRWTLFAPDLKDLESSIYITLADDQDPSQLTEVDLAATVRTRSRSRLLYPSRIDRTVEFCSRQLSNASTLVQNARRITTDPNKQRLQFEAERFLVRAERTCLPIVSVLAHSLNRGRLVSARIALRIASGVVTERLVCDAGHPVWQRLSEAALAGEKLPTPSRIPAKEQPICEPK